MSKVTVLGNEITTSKFNDEDYISITNIEKYKNFKPIEFDGFRKNKYSNYGEFAIIIHKVRF